MSPQYAGLGNDHPGRSPSANSKNLTIFIELRFFEKIAYFARIKNFRSQVTHFVLYLTN